MPASDSGDDAVRIGGPDEGLRVGVVVGDEEVDGGLEIDHRAEDAALQPASGEPGEEALDGVEPRARGRDEVEGEARVAVEPAPDLRVLMGGVTTGRLVAPMLENERTSMPGSRLESSAGSDPRPGEALESTWRRRSREPADRVGQSTRPVSKR